MARLPIETGSGSAKNLSYLLFSMGDTRDKGLNAFVNGFSGFGNTLSAYHQQQRDFREKQQEKQRLESLELQKMQQQEAARLSDEAYRNAELGLKKAARLSDEAYRNAELGLRKEALEFEKYKFNNPQEKDSWLDMVHYDNQNSWNQGFENQNTQNAQNLQNQNTQNTQMPQMPKEQAESIKPSTLRSAELSQFFKESDTNNTPAQNYTNQNYTNQNYNQDYNQNGTNQVPKYVRVKTGFPYFDNKQDLSGRDIMNAKKMLGIDLVEERKDVELKTTNVGKSLDRIKDNMVSLRSTSQLFLETQNNAGFRNGLARWLHNKTGGLTPLNDTLARYHARDLSNTKNIAQAQAGGKATNQDKEDAKVTYGTALKSPRLQRNILSGALEETLNELSEEIQWAEQKGVVLPQGVMNKYLMYRDLSNYIKSTENTGKFSWAKARNMVNYIQRSDDGSHYNYDEWAKIKGKQN